MTHTRRTLASIGVAGTLALAGIGGVITHSAHASGPPTATVQQQVGTQSSTGADTEVAAPEASSETSAPEASTETSTAAKTAGTEADAPGGANVQNGPNDQSGADVQGNG